MGVGPAGLMGDVAVGAVQARGGVGDPGCKGYPEHGVGLPERGSRKQSHSDGTPPRAIALSSKDVSKSQLANSRYGSSWDGAQGLSARPAKPGVIGEKSSHSRRASVTLFPTSRTDPQSSRGSLFLRSASCDGSRLSYNDNQTRDPHPAKRTPRCCQRT